MTTPPLICRWLLDLGAALVPADARADWRREWRAEIHAFQAARPDDAPDVAWRLAARCLGAIVHAAWLRWDRWRLEMWTYDLRIAVRTLWHQPGFAAVAALTLAVGIGANAAVFSAVYAVLLRPLPFPGADRLVAIRTTSPQGAPVGSATSPSDFVDWQADAGAFEALAALSSDDLAMSGPPGAEQVPGAAVSGGFFAVIGLTPQRGRVISPDDARPGAAPVVVVSDTLWARRFGRAPDAVGRLLTVDGVAREVVGILPPGLVHPPDTEAWVPLSWSPTELATQRGAQYLDVIGRLRAGGTLADADTELTAIAARLATTYPGTNDGRGVRILPFRDALVGDVGPSLIMLLAAAGLVLLIVCVNVAGLLVTRAIGRSHDLSMRVALGAGPWRLVRGVLAETLVLGLAGAMAGTAIAWAGVRRIASLEAATRVPLLAETRLDAAVLAAIAALAIASALAVGLIPAWRTPRRVGLARHDGTRATRRGAARSWLVATEVALALVLAVGAVTLARGFSRILAVPRGFEVSDRILTAALTLPEARYDTPARRADFVARALEQVRGLPGVETAGAVFGLPLTGFGFSITVVSKDGTAMSTSPQDEVVLAVRAMSPDYPRAMGMALRRGRVFSSRDDGSRPPSVLVNETAARLLWPGVDPLGRSLLLGTHLGQDEHRTGGTVVGVVGDTRDGAVDRPVRPTVFVPLAQEPVSFVTLVLRGAARTPDAAALRTAVNALDPDLPLFRVRTVAQLASATLAQPRLLMSLMSLFAAAAVLVAAIGLYGLLAQAVAARVREIGVRRAIGATTVDVASLVAGQTSRTVGAGAAVGIAASWAASGVLERFVYGSAGPDLAAYATAVGGLAAVAAVAAIAPCRRAMAVDPAVALKGE